jgi:hypothetical protein
MTRRFYTNTATEATLTGGVGAAETTIPLTSFAGFPAAPFTATISRGLADEEVVLVSAVSSSTVTVVRGYDGTTAKSHAAGATFVHTTIAKDFDEANAHIQAAAGVHGLAGSVVGTSDTQTLANKTLTAPVLSAPSVTGTASLASATLSGTLSVTGASTLAGVAASGNASVGGTLTATGAATLSSTLSVTGAATLSAALTVAGLASLNGGVTVPAGKKVTLTDAPATGTDAVNKTYADAREAAAKAYTDTRETAIKSYADAQDASFGRHRGSGTAYPGSPVEGDTFRRTDLGYTARYDGTNWLPTLALHGGGAATPATATLAPNGTQTFTTGSIVVPPGARLRLRARVRAISTAANEQTLTLSTFTVTSGATLVYAEPGYLRVPFAASATTGAVISAEMLIDTGSLSAITVTFQAASGNGNNSWALDAPQVFYTIGAAAP